MRGREVALEMLVDEEELEELIVGERDGDEPWGGQEKKERAAGDEVQTPPDRKIARDERIEDQRAARDHDADQALGQRGTGHRGPGDPHPAPSLAWRRGVPLGQHKGAERDRQQGAQRAVQRQQVGVHDIAATARQRRRAVEPEHRSLEAQAHVTEEQGCEQRRQRRPQPRGPRLHAERLVRHGGHPVLERRLLEVLEAVKTRRQPIARHHHLARNLGVAPLVRMNDRPVVGAREPDHGECQDQDGEGAARERGVRWHRRAGFGVRVRMAEGQRGGRAAMIRAETRGPAGAGTDSTPPCGHFRDGSGHPT